MHSNIVAREQERIALQSYLDAEKTQAERNRLGQFATPNGLAEEILRYAAALLPPHNRVHFLDPVFGTGSFYSAILRVIPQERMAEALGFEIDPHYGAPAERLWRDTGLKLRLADFTQAEPSAQFNMLICNPPYVRHHHLNSEDKTRLQLRSQQASGMAISGLAGLYCHFLGASHAWMTQGGIAGWLIPSEFMDVNYGHAVKQYLLERVTLLHIHRFDPKDVQFADALVSSAIVWLRKERPAPNHEVKFTFGGTLSAPRITRVIPASELAVEPKWTRFPRADLRSQSDTPVLSDFFRIKRGVATGDNNFFILSEKEIVERGLPIELFAPILPSPRYMSHDEVKARRDGTPDIERRLFLLDTRLSEEEIHKRFPSLFKYLEQGKASGLDERYLCKHRTPWYSQEHRPPAPIVCTYLGRGDSKSGRPFRFILNGSAATVANVYLALYPTPLMLREMERDPGLLRKVWGVLNKLPPEVLLGEGRVYGGGLHKLEPRELSNVPAQFVADLCSLTTPPMKTKQLGLFAPA